MDELSEEKCYVRWTWYVWIPSGRLEVANLKFWEHRNGPDCVS